MERLQAERLVMVQAERHGCGLRNLMTLTTSLRAVIAVIKGQEIEMQRLVKLALPWTC